MDAEKFDELVARLAAGPTRRDALKGVVGGALAASGLPALADAVDAKGKGKGRGGKGRKGRGGKGRGGNGRGGGGGGGGKGRDDNDNDKDRNRGAGAQDDDDVSAEKKGAGKPCKKNRQCLSGRCKKGKKKKNGNGRKKGRCRASGEGKPCKKDNDCKGSLLCVSGIDRSLVLPLVAARPPGCQRLPPR